MSELLLVVPIAKKLTIILAFNWVLLLYLGNRQYSGNRLVCMCSSARSLGSWCSSAGCRQPTPAKPVWKAEHSAVGAGTGKPGCVRKRQKEVVEKTSEFLE